MQNPVRGSMKVDAVNLRGFDNGFCRQSRSHSCDGRCGLFAHSHARCEVRGFLQLWLVRQLSPAKQTTICDQLLALRIEGGLNCHGSWLVLVELERRKEVHFFNRLNVPSRMQARSSLGECLDTHHSGQHRNAIDTVVVKERLRLRIKRSFYCETGI